MLLKISYLFKNQKTVFMLVGRENILFLVFGNDDNKLSIYVLKKSSISWKNIVCIFQNKVFFNFKLFKLDSLPLFLSSRSLMKGHAINCFGG